MGSTKNIAQMGDAWSLRFSARIQRFSMVLYLLILYLAPRKGKQHCAQRKGKGQQLPVEGADAVGDDVGSLVPVPNRKWHYLMNPQFNSAGGSVDSPCFTLIARMDKMPPYLVATESGQVAIEIYNNDSPMTVKIKEFMALYGIVDIKMRMLRIPELKKIMGFPEDYVLIGTQADQKKFIGNAVEVTQARKNTEALCKVLKKLRLKKLKEIA